VTRFHEEQRFGSGWVVLLLGFAGFLAVAFIAGVAASGAWADLPLLAVGPLLVLGLAWLFDRSRLVVEVNDDAVTISFRYLWPTRRIPFGDITGLAVRRYSGLLEYGGWGVRVGPKGWAYMIGGEEGVQLRLHKGLPVLIGSKRPRELEAAMRSRMESIARST
jgi:hypothetical protein